MRYLQHTYILVFISLSPIFVSLPLSATNLDPSLNTKKIDTKKVLYLAHKKKQNDYPETATKPNSIKTTPFDLNKQFEDEELEDPFLHLKVKQDLNKPKIGFFSIGIKGFLQIADNMYLGAEGKFSLNTQLLAGGGLFLDFRFSRYISFEIDLFYQVKGISLDGRKNHLFYISTLPYLKVFPAGEIFFIGFGPSIQIHTFSKLSIASSQEIKPLFLSYGITGGIGIQITSYPWYFSLEYRVDIGIGSMLSATDIIAADIRGYPLVFKDMQIILGLGVYLF